MQDSADLVPLVYEDILDGYFINRLGEIYSSRIKGEMRKLKAHVSTTRGYLHITLRTQDRRSRMFCVHVLVCATFHERPVDIIVHACHRDGNKLNVKASNMYWGTPVQNMEDRERHRIANGRLHHRAKLSTEQVVEIRRRVHAGEQVKVLARELGLSASNVADIYKGVFWKMIPLDYEPRDLKETGAKRKGSLSRETIFSIYRLRGEGKTFTEISACLGGSPHKVTVRDICNNAVDAYKELYKEYYQNVDNRSHVGAQ